MALRDKIKNWEIELGKVQKAKQDAIEKYDKKEKELIKKIEDAKNRIERENEKAVGDIVREMYGELTEENILRFKEFLKSSAEKSTDISSKL